MPTVEEMIEQSQAAASQLPTTRSEPTQLQTSSPARAPSLDSLEQSSLTVDNWLKVSEDGLKIVVEGDSCLMDNLDVFIDMNEVVATTAIKFSNPPVYHKTYDGLMCADRTTRWVDAIEQGARFNARPYDSADIPMTLRQDVVGKKGKVIMESGQRIGYSLSTTNREAFANFRKSLRADGLIDSTVDVKLGCQPKTNKAGNTWGIVTFENEGEHSE